MASSRCLLLATPRSRPSLCIDPELRTLDMEIFPDLSSDSEVQRFLMRYPTIATKQRGCYHMHSSLLKGGGGERGRRKNRQREKEREKKKQASVPSWLSSSSKELSPSSSTSSMSDGRSSSPRSRLAASSFSPRPERTLFFPVSSSTRRPRKLGDFAFSFFGAVINIER